MHSTSQRHRPARLRRPAARWTLLLAATLALRGGWLVAASHRLTDDPDGYRALARNLVDHGVLGQGTQPTAYRPVLYPLVLAACLASGADAWAIAALHLVLGTATVLATFWLATQWLLPPDVQGAPVGPMTRTQRLLPWFAAALVACDPILLNQSSLVMTETLATLLAAAVLVAMTRLQDRITAWRAAQAGVCLGLASLCRPTFLPATLAVALLLAWRIDSWRRRSTVAGALLLAAAAALAPWAIRNWRQFGRPVVSTTHGGYTLLLGNNPLFYEHLSQGRPGDVWKADLLDRQVARQRIRSGGNEISHDRREYRQAWRNMADQPAMFLRATRWRLSRLWSPIPQAVQDTHSLSSRSTRILVGLWYIPQFGLALAGAWALGRRLFRPPWLWPLVLAATFTAIHALYWSNMRMRAPLVPGIALFSAAGLAALAGCRLCPIQQPIQDAHALRPPVRRPSSSP